MSRRSRQRNSCCGTNRNKKVTKIRPDVPDREASPDAPPDFFLISFWSSRPEHNQRPPTDTAKRRFALIPTRRKIAVSPLGAQSTPPLAGGRSGGRLIIHPLPNVAGSAADRSTLFLLNGAVGDGPRAHFKKKKRTSNQEGGPPVFRGGLLIIHPLLNVAGSAADRSTFCLLNGVVGGGPRAHSTSTSRRAGRDDHRFFKKEKRTSNQEVGTRCLGAGF